MKNYVRISLSICLTSLLSCSKLADDITVQDNKNLDATSRMETISTTTSLNDAIEIENLALNVSKDKDFIQLAQLMKDSWQKTQNELKKLSKSQQEARDNKIKAILDGKSNEVDYSLLFTTKVEFENYSRKFTKLLFDFKAKFNNIDKLVLERAFNMLGARNIQNGRVEADCIAQYGGCLDTANGSFIVRAESCLRVEDGGGYGSTSVCLYMAGLELDRAERQCGYNLDVCMFFGG
jgi:hypothetical protein